MCTILFNERPLSKKTSAGSCHGPEDFLAMTFGDGFVVMIKRQMWKAAHGSGSWQEFWSHVLSIALVSYTSNLP